MSTTIDQVLAQYEKSKSSAAGSNANSISSEERLKKYFTTLLPKGQHSGERRIRILPTTDGTSPFKEVYFHEIQVDGKWMKIYDPKQDGEKSPLNEVYQALMETGLESDRTLARTYKARKFFIVKVIDRDNEQDGPKFWRVKHNYKNEGPIDKIFPLFKLKGDITDAQTGRDLIISLSLNKAPNGREYTTISSVMYDDATPLHTNPETLNEWVNHPDQWSDVYSKKSIEYLELVAGGHTPKWNSELKKFVSGSEESDVQFSSSNVTAPIHEDPQTNAQVDDDLPF